MIYPPTHSHKKPLQSVMEWCASRGMPSELLEKIPSDYTRYGSTLVFRFPLGIPGKFEALAAEAWARVLEAKSVLKVTGIIHGTYREPAMKRLYGPGGDVIHRENGIRFRFDPEKVMFSPGNLPERMRIAELDIREETVVDLFAGIGYFSLPAAVHAKAERVYSCEINPVAFRYLEENIRLNHAENITSLFGDNRETAPMGVADRVLMGYVDTTHLFLPTAFRALKEEGIIHYHEVCPLNHLPKRPVRRIKQAAEKFGGIKIDVVRVGKVKSYGPKMVHVVVDVRVKREIEKR